MEENSKGHENGFTDLSQVSEYSNRCRLFPPHILCFTPFTSIDSGKIQLLILTERQSKTTT